MEILLVSTLKHNPGDEFIRLGVEHVLRKLYPDATFRIVHKHDPRTLFAGFKQRAKTPRRLVSPWLYRLYAATAGSGKQNYLESADLVAFAGTPFIWRSSVKLFPFNSANAEWVPAIWNRLFREFGDKPVVNVSAGTSVTNQEQFDAILGDPVVSGFLKRAVSRCLLTTARDVKTQEILKALGFDVAVIPCASIMAARGAGLQPQTPEYVAVNIMRSAAHSWRGQRGHSSAWKEAAEALIAEIEKRHKVLFVSHSRDEDATVAEWFPGRPRFYSKDPIALLRVYSKAKFGVCNRVHAGAAIASFGRPAMVIGGDSRINLVQQFGLPAYDHRDVDAAKAVSLVREFEDSLPVYAAELARRTEMAEMDYVEALSRALGKSALVEV